MSTPRPALLQPAALGLSGGMVIGAIYLVARAMLLSHADCPAGTTAEDCALESEIAREMSVFFYFFAFGLMLVGLGVFVIFRPKKKGAA
jgi:hypothetical protein